MKNEQKYLKIGEISKLTGIAVSALRYYEEIGLLMPSYRNQSKYRYYKPADVSLLNFIKKSQHLGFSLDEIKEILGERSKGQSPCPLVRKFAAKKIDELEHKISELKSLEEEIKEYVTECHDDLDTNPSDEKICALIDKVKI